MSYISPETFENVIENNILQIKELILTYMRECKAVKNAEYVQIILVLCVEHKPLLLNKPEFYHQLPLALVLENTKVLEDHKLFHSIALINSLSNRAEISLNLWKDLVDGIIQDTFFPGFEYIISYLCGVKDAKLIWKYADWAFNKNQEQVIENADFHKILISIFFVQ